MNVAMHPIDLAGQKFGRWTVVRRAENTAQGQARWLCRCECGNSKVLKSILIRRGISRSCGCLHDEVVTVRSTKHGHANAGAISPTYHSWAGMVARCSSEKHKNFQNYGGRGIKVCERWLTFANFLADMGEKPPGTSLDRINGNGNYEPSNCRWATATQQSRNRRSNRILTMSGVSRTVAEWSEVLGVHVGTLSWRVQQGWSDVDVLTRPLQHRNKLGRPSRPIKR